MSRTITEKCPNTAFAAPRPTTLPSRTLTTGTVVSCRAYSSTPRWPGQERSAARRRPVACPASIAPELSCAVLSPLRLLLGHHRRDAAAAGRSVEEADRRDLQLDRQRVEVEALRRDRTVGVTAARREVVGADDRRPAVDRAPAADVTGRRERGDPSVGVVSWRSRRGCRPRGTSRRRGAARSARGTSTCRERADGRRPGSVEPSARRAAASPRSVSTSSSTGSHVSSRRSSRCRRRPRRRARAMTATIMSCVTASPGPQREEPDDDAVARRRRRAPPSSSRVTTISVSPARTSSPSATRTSTTLPVSGLATGCSPGETCSGAGPATTDACDAAATAVAPTPACASSSASAPRSCSSDDGRDRRQLRRFGEQRRPCVAGPHVRVAEDRDELREVRGDPCDVELLDGTAGAIDGVGDRLEPRRSRSPWRATGRTAAVVRTRRSRRVDAHAGTGRLLVRGQHAGSRRDDPRLHGDAAVDDCGLRSRCRGRRATRRQRSGTAPRRGRRRSPAPSRCARPGSAGCTR